MKGTSQNWTAKTVAAVEKRAAFDLWHVSLLTTLLPIELIDQKEFIDEAKIWTHFLPVQVTLRLLFPLVCHLQKNYLFQRVIKMPRSKRKSLSNKKVHVK